MDIADNIRKLNASLPETVKLVAVSKNRTPEEIMRAYNTGHRIFGENKVQELAGKQRILPEDIDWHMIGHLQSNKVKYIAGFVEVIQSVDSQKLLEVINKEALRCNRTIKCLIQLHIADEEHKFGFSYEELKDLFNSGILTGLKNVRLIGLMGMATFTEETDTLKREFKQLKDSFLAIKEDFFKNDDGFREISMGMSGDYMLAIEEGSTMVRLGTLIFGERD